MWKDCSPLFLKHYCKGNFLKHLNEISNFKRKWCSSTHLDAGKYYQSIRTCDWFIINPWHSVKQEIESSFFWFSGFRSTEDYFHVRFQIRARYRHFCFGRFYSLTTKVTPILLVDLVFHSNNFYYDRRLSAAELHLLHVSFVSSLSFSVFFSSLSLSTPANRKLAQELVILQMIMLYCFAWRCQTSNFRRRILFFTLGTKPNT